MTHRLTWRKIISQIRKYELMPSLPHSTVFAHFACPPTIGTTELISTLRDHIYNIDLVDLYDYNSLALDMLGWSHLDKGEFSDYMQHYFFTHKQILINETIIQADRPIIFFGSHKDDDFTYRLCAEYKYYVKMFCDKLERRSLHSLGYDSISPRKVYMTLMDWSQKYEQSRKTTPSRL